MPDYGHPLRFGTFVTPYNAPPLQPVLLAELSERLGYDLVTIQDHPYQPRFHDTWTLLSFIAARTERIHLAPNVANIPLRPPAVLARAAVSLDLLSGGRLDLAVGAGAFWDAIEAMGGRRLEPGESVQALGEAIDVIRNVWSMEPGGAFTDGAYYRVRGAKRGPAAAHPIPIWVGALKPRMLRLTGTKGDGWLVSLGRVDEAGLRAGNRIIDDAAAAAGREPASVVRLLNVGVRFRDGADGSLGGSMRDRVDQLLPLVLQDGFSVFIVDADDPPELERFAHEVIPTLREAVALERGTVGGS